MRLRFHRNADKRVIRCAEIPNQLSEDIKTHHTQCSLSYLDRRAAYVIEWKRNWIGRKRTTVLSFY